MDAPCLTSSVLYLPVPLSSQPALLCPFLPPLLWATTQRCILQMILLAGPGVVITAALVGVTAKVSIRPTLQPRNIPPSPMLSVHLLDSRTCGGNLLTSRGQPGGSWSRGPARTSSHEVRCLPLEWLESWILCLLCKLFSSQLPVGSILDSSWLPLVSFLASSFVPLYLPGVAVHPALRLELGHSHGAGRCAVLH